MSRKRLVGVGLVLTVLAGFFALASRTEAAGEQETVTVQGELLDLGCYLDHGAKGAGHRECAVMCAKAGGPLGVMNEADQTIYIVTGDHGAMSPELLALAGENVIITGKPMIRNGISAIFPKTISKVGGVVAQPPASRPAR